MVQIDQSILYKITAVGATAVVVIAVRNNLKFLMIMKIGSITIPSCGRQLMQRTHSATGHGAVKSGWEQLHGCQSLIGFCASDTETSSKTHTGQWGLDRQEGYCHKKVNYLILASN